jgi:hypothetical protein
VALHPVLGAGVVAEVEGEAALRSEVEDAGFQFLALQEAQPERVARVNAGRLFIDGARAELFCELAARRL